MLISGEQVINRLRQARFKHNRQADRVIIMRQAGSGQRVNVPRRDYLPEKLVRVILAQAGLSSAEIDKFVAAAVKDC